MKTTRRDRVFLTRMAAMMLAGFALLAAGVLLDPPSALLRRITRSSKWPQ
jgi:hypothetical protein